MNKLDNYMKDSQEFTQDFKEFDDPKSYRGILYTEFGFSSEAYGAAQLSGFLNLHNCIYPDGLETIETGLKLYGIETTEAEIRKKIKSSYNLVKNTQSLFVGKYSLTNNKD